MRRCPRKSTQGADRDETASAYVDGSDEFHRRCRLIESVRYPPASCERDAFTANIGFSPQSPRHLGISDPESLESWSTRVNALVHRSDQMSRRGTAKARASGCRAEWKNACRARASGVPMGPECKRGAISPPRSRELGSFGFGSLRTSSV